MSEYKETTLPRCCILLIFIGMFAAGQTQTKFITAFMENYSVSSATTFQLYLVTYDKAASVTVMVSKPQFNQTVFIERDTSALVTLNYTYMITEKEVTSKAVLVTSDVDISVFAFYTAPNTADAMACLHLEDLGTEYYISTTWSGASKQFAVANGLEEVVLVNVTVSGSIIFNGVDYGHGESFSFSLGYQQAVQFQSSVDLTGTRITSTAPVAVFSGQKCFAGVNNACDTLVQQLYPVKNWGSFFAVFPLLNHTKDTIKIIAASPDTLVNVSSPQVDNQYNIQKGSYIEITVKEIMTVNSTRPIMITYIFQDYKPDVVKSYDPSLISVPPSLASRTYFKFVTQNTYYNFLLIVFQASAGDGIYLDHRQLSLQAPNVAMKYFNGFKAWEVNLGKSEGQHEIYHESLPFTIYVYGIEKDVSYGYSMGQDTVYPDPPLPKPTETPEPEGTLNCLSHGAEYHLPLSLVSEADLTVSDVHLEDPLCQAELEGDVALIKIPFSGCGSTVLNEDGKTYYINTIYGTIPETSVQRIEIPVICEMEMNETLGLHFHPKVTDVVSHGHYNVSLRLYQNSDFADAVTTYPHVADIHGHLYVEFKVEADDAELQILAENCKASPSLEDTEQLYHLVQHGCPVDSTLRTHPVSDQRLQRFSFHVFRINNFQEVYLSCNVIVCHNGTSPNRCTQGCLNRRHRRDALGSRKVLSSARLSQGPIVFKSGQVQTPRTVPVSVLVAVIGVMGFVSALVLVIHKQRYRRHQYTLLENRSD